MQCHFRWYAARQPKPTSPRGAGGFYALGGHHGAAAARAATAVSKYQIQMDAFLRWKRCPNCGSQKVVTSADNGAPGHAPASGVPTWSGSAVAPPPLAPQGWYLDPLRVAALRWWDGQGWTDHIADSSG